MKKLFTSFFILVSSFIFCQVPTFQWATSYLGGPMYAHSTVTDASDNSYVFGDFQGTVDFDPPTFGLWSLTAQGAYPTVDVYVTKTDPLGNMIWAQQIQNGDYEIGSAMAIDASGNTYVTGYFQNVTPATPYTIFVAKLNSNGSVLWRRVIRGPGSGTSPIPAGIPYGIDVDAAGNVYVSGIFSDTLDFNPIGTFTLATAKSFKDDGFILKLNTNGGFVWARQIANKNGMPTIKSIVADNVGDIYYTGYTNDTTDFDPGVGTYTLTAGAFVSKLTSAGNFVWAKQVVNAEAIALELDNSNNIYYTGNFSGTGIADFDMGIGTYTLNSTAGNAFMSKIDASGNFIWAKQFGGTPQSITLDAIGDPYISGKFSNTIDVDPGPLSYTFAAISNTDIYINKLNSAGNFMWAAQMGGTSSWEDAEDICVSSVGSVYVVGMADYNTDLDPGPGNASVSNNYTYALKLGQSTTGIKNIVEAKEIIVYPNPTTGQFKLEFSSIKQKTEIKITNSLGQLILQKNISSTDKISLSISDQPSGIYFVEVNADGESYRTKVVKE